MKKDYSLIRMRSAYSFILLIIIILFFLRNNSFGWSIAAHDYLSFDDTDTYALEFSSHLPIMVIQTSVDDLKDRSNPPRAIIWYFNNGYENRLTDKPAEVYSFTTANFRGNSTFNCPNPGYSLSFYNFNYITPLDISFFDLEPASEWVLRTTYADPIMIKDWFAYELADTLLDWQPRGGTVHVFRQDNDSESIDYLGIFFLSQYIPAYAHTALNLGEFNLSEARRIDFEGGGYIAQRNRLLSNNKVRVNTFRVDYPTIRDMTPQQESYLRNELRFITDLIRNPVEHHDSEDDCKYWQYLDIDTCTDVFLFGELIKLADRGQMSSFIYRRAGEKVHFGPIWDCDGSMGFAYDDMQASCYYFQKEEPLDFFLNFLSCRVFTEMLVTKWQEYRNSIWADDKILELYDFMSNYMKEPAQQHVKLPFYSRRFGSDAKWNEEIKQIRSWLIQRLNWLDEYIPQLLYKTYDEINNEFQSSLEASG